MVSYGMGQRPGVIYAMVSGTGTSSANLRVEHSDGDWIPLQTTPDGHLMVDTELIMSGTTVEINNLKVGSTNQVEANKYLQTTTAGVQIVNISGTVTAALDNLTDDILIYGNDTNLNRKIRTDAYGSIELGSGTLTALETTTVVVSGTVISIIEEANDSILIYGNDGVLNRVIQTDSYGALELGSGTMAALEHITAVISGTVLAELEYDNDSVSIYGIYGPSYRQIQTDNYGAIELGSGTLTALEAITAVVSGTMQSLIINGTGSAAVNVQDGGNSLTVDQATPTNLKTLVYGSDDGGTTARVVKTDSTGGVELGTTSLAALEGITAVVSGTIQSNIVNDVGSAAVNIQDGGNSLTVDGTVDLGATTLTALETVTAVISGTVITAEVEAQNPFTYNTTMTSASTEYSQALPAGTKKFSMQCRTAFNVQLSFDVGQSGVTYTTIKAGTNYFEDNVDLPSTTAYFQCADANKVFEILAWT